MLAADYPANDAAETTSDIEPIQPAAERGVMAAQPVEPQYRVHQPPRVQLGNAPLPGSAAFDGSDQIEILWQTMPAGNGTDDSFQVKLRRAGAAPSDPWSVASSSSQMETNVGGRTMHAAVFQGLAWNTSYDYEVSHYRRGEVVGQYNARFQTRLAPGDPTPYTFAAYGDSAIAGTGLAGFRKVQQRISESPAAFSVLLGDNMYDFGTHTDADARFDPVLNPEATHWIASHIDYFGIGNHEMFSGYTASLDSFAMPQPIAGVNAFANPPVGEPAELYGSFVYGDAHFVTWNSNSAEQLDDDLLAEQMKFLADNLAASQATWKIVYMHHPFVGSLKLDLYSNTNYVEMIVPVLREAGVDLVLVGDSHTFAWTYPIQGLEDRNQDDEIAADEVVFQGGSAYEFTKGNGVIQLISGVGGRNVRTDPFGQPYMAQAHSRHANTLPGELGYAEVRVAADAIVVQYRSAESGNVVGDTNGNGRRDPDESTFAEFRIVNPDALVTPDVNRDGQVDALDLNAICAAVLGDSFESRLDLNADATIDPVDHRLLWREHLRARQGDANLDGRVNSSDLVQVFQLGRFEMVDDLLTGWEAGDWNCDGRFTSSDLVVMFVSGYEQDD